VKKFIFGVAAIFLLPACMFPEERRGIAVIASTSIDPWVAACVVVDVRHRRSAPLHATDGRCGPLWPVVVISHTLRVRIKFMGKYGRPPLALAGLLVIKVE